jgi:predicted Zn-dependent protease
MLRWKWILKSLTASDQEAIYAEREAGRDMLKALTKAMMPVSRNRGDHALVETVGKQLADRLKDKHWRFAFYVVRSRQTNAFALPGGFVLVTEPILRLFGREKEKSELAAILAHEMAHVVLLHARDRVLAKTLFSLLAARNAIGQLAEGFALGRYSQEQELDADRFGVRLIRAAAFDAEASQRMLQTLQEYFRHEQGSSNFFSSHPPFDIRIKNIKE